MTKGELAKKGGESVKIGYNSFSDDNISAGQLSFEVNEALFLNIQQHPHLLSEFRGFQRP